MLLPLKGSLGEGKFALVDAEDFEYLCQFNWQIEPTRGYVRRSIYSKEAYNST